MPAVTSVLAAAALVGGGISAYGQYRQGQESKEAEDYNARILEEQAANERMVSNRETDIIRQNAILNEYRTRKSLASVTGQQVSGYAGRGVDVSTGSPLDVMADTIANAELEIAIGNWNAENEIAVSSYNAEISARNKESEARMRRLYGKSAATNATYQAVGTLLSAGAEGYSRLSKEKPGKVKKGYSRLSKEKPGKVKIGE